MVKIKDSRVILGKTKVRESIRNEFARYMDEGRTYDYAIEKLIAKYGYSESTIYQIVKRIGKYSD